MKYLGQHDGAGTTHKPHWGSRFSHQTAAQQTRAAVVLAPGAKCKAQAGEQEEGNPGPKVRSQGDLMLAGWQGKEVSEDPTGAGTV